MAHVMARTILPCAAACALLGDVLFLLWMAAGLLAVAAFAALLNGGLVLARSGDRPLEDWPILRRFGPRP